MMKPTHFVLFSGLIIISIAGYLGFNYSKPQPITETVSRPIFSLPDLQGQNRTNTEWDGKVVIINFWATWCPPCIKEIPMFIKLQEKYAAQGLQLVGIAIDNPKAVQEFVNNKGINYPILVGEQDAITVANRFGNHFGTLPFTVVIDRQAQIVRRHPGEMEQQQ
jgi:thiol-disulfide isomerase/thioredoxin